MDGFEAIEVLHALSMCSTAVFLPVWQPATENQDCLSCVSGQVCQPGLGAGKELSHPAQGKERGNKQHTNSDS